MLKTTPFHDNDYPRVVSYLKKFDPNLPNSSWKKLLFYTWENPYSYRGMMLEDGDKIVGFLCYVISKSQINEKHVTFCNISSWVVDIDYRKKSLQLLSPLFRIENILILNLSPHKNILPIFDALRFNKLSEYEYIANPFKAIIKGQKKPKNKTYTIIEKKEDSLYSNHFSDIELKYIKDLEPYENVKAYCIEIHEGEEIHKLTLFFNKKVLRSNDLKSKIKELPYSILGRKYQYELLYVGSTSILIEHLENILYTFLMRSDVRSLSVSEHFIRKKDPHLNFVSKIYRDRPWYTYTDKEIDEAQINILFTEKVLLNF